MVKLESIAPYEQEIIEIFKQIHMHPEPGFFEFNTAALIKEKLRAWGLDVRENLAMTGVMGVLDTGKPGRTVLLRADMDCLPVIEASGVEYCSQSPGLMHACGHDTHVAMLLGAAKYMSEHPDELCGKVKFVFQPAEEGTTDSRKAEVAELGLGTTDGAQIMIAQGVADGVDACFAIHIDSTSPVGTGKVCRKEAMASADQFDFVIKGTGGHGSSPQTATDPVSAAAVAIQTINLIPARSVSAFDQCVISIGTLETPGSRWNIIPANVRAGGTVRTFNDEVRKRTFELIEQRVADAAKTFGCEYEFKLTPYYAPTVNDPDVAALVLETGRELMGEGMAYAESPSMGGEDVGYFFRKAPGALMMLGGSFKNDPKPATLHSPYVRIDPSALKYGVAMHVNMCIKLTKPL